MRQRHLIALISLVIFKNQIKELNKLIISDIRFTIWSISYKVEKIFEVIFGTCQPKKLGRLNIFLKAN